MSAAECFPISAVSSVLIGSCPVPSSVRRIHIAQLVRPAPHFDG